MLTLSALLVGCYSPEDFGDEFNAVNCDKIYECFDESVIELVPDAGQDVESCYEERDEPTDADDDDCAFDAKVAQECVDATAAMACGDYTGGTNWPVACELVCGEDAE